jgi:hypothetical protein
VIWPVDGPPAGVGHTAVFETPRLLAGAGEGNRTLMTSLEGVPHRAVVGADLHVGVAGGSRG